MNTGLDHFRQMKAAHYYKCEVTAFEDPRDDSIWRVKIGSDRIGAAMDEMMARRIAAALKYFDGVLTEDIEKAVSNKETLSQVPEKEP
jgi:hypothetical protein